MPPSCAFARTSECVGRGIRVGRGDALALLLLTYDRPAFLPLRLVWKRTLSARNQDSQMGKGSQRFTGLVAVRLPEAQQCEHALPSFLEEGSPKAQHANK